MTIPRGQRFWKMSGSGNDFIFFDSRGHSAPELEMPAFIERICARATGIGADGIVIVQDDAAEAFRIRYLNRDGSLGEICGNASLCSTRLAHELGIGGPADFRFQTDAGVLTARMREAEPEIDLQPPTELTSDAGVELGAGERRIGFVNSGVPHLVVLVPDAHQVDVVGRGRELRHHPSLAHGANVNFVSQASAQEGWRMRTYERGVEGETLACGTGAVASAVLLRSWGLAGDLTAIRTTSGRQLSVRLLGSGEPTRPSLRGEGRVVFVGELSEP